MSYYNGDYKATSANFIDYIDKDHNQIAVYFTHLRPLNLLNILKCQLFAIDCINFY